MKDYQVPAATDNEQLIAVVKNAIGHKNKSALWLGVVLIVSAALVGFGFSVDPIMSMVHVSILLTFAISWKQSQDAWDKRLEADIRNALMNAFILPKPPQVDKADSA